MRGQHFILYSTATYQFLRFLALIALSAVWLVSLNALDDAAPVVAVSIGGLVPVALFVQMALTRRRELVAPAILAKALELIVSINLVSRHPAVAARFGVASAASLAPITPVALTIMALLDATILLFLVLYLVTHTESEQPEE